MYSFCLMIETFIWNICFTDMTERINKKEDEPKQNRQMNLDSIQQIPYPWTWCRTRLMKKVSDITLDLYVTQSQQSCHRYSIYNICFYLFLQHQIIVFTLFLFLCDIDWYIQLPNMTIWLFCGVFVMNCRQLCVFMSFSGAIRGRVLVVRACAI